MNNQFNYLENIIIQTNDPEFAEINNKTGTVIGQPDIKDEKRMYIIYFALSEDLCWSVPENYLSSTGQFATEESIYG